MANIFSTAWHMLDSMVNRTNSNSEESLPATNQQQQPTPSVPAPQPATVPQWNYPQTQIRVRGPASAMWSPLAPRLSRHVTFTHSTLLHVAHRDIVIHGETSGFQNFVREMYESYYKMKLDQEWRLGLLEDEYPIHNRRLSFKDLVLMQRVARDMWHCMNKVQRKVYKDLADEVKQRRRLRLPPDPYRTPVTLMGKKKVHKTKSIYQSMPELE